MYFCLLGSLHVLIFINKTDRNGLPIAGMLSGMLRSEFLSFRITKFALVSLLNDRTVEIEHHSKCKRFDL